MLRRLRELNWITEAEYDAALKQPLVFKQMADGMGRQGAWYLEEVRRQLIELFSEENAKRLGIELPVYGEDAVYQMGFTVRTAMDPPAQMALMRRCVPAGRLYPPPRLAWPVEKIPAADLKGRIEKSHFSPYMLANGERVKGIVTRITDKGVDVRLGKYSGFIDNAQLSWAKKTLRSKQKFLESGDVVWVAAVSDPKIRTTRTEGRTGQALSACRSNASRNCRARSYPLSRRRATWWRWSAATVSGKPVQPRDAGVRQPGSSFKPIRLLRRAGQRLYGGFRHPRRARGAVP